MTKTYVLDTSAFIYGIVPDGELVTPSRVYEEVKDEKSRLKLELISGLIVRDPCQECIAEIEDAALKTGDKHRISLTDRDLLALALEEKGSGKDVKIMTDDYAIQNIARKIGIDIVPLHQKKIKQKIEWEKRCIGCNRIYSEGEICDVCGSPLRLKKRSISRGKKNEKR
ncbi:DNA-binding protein [Methanocella sp. CWC-04]|uniref:DNA-binding protein n=1 Tax=Methanooceanicella nereidis TaxID=2052831 RepID=A0AAP2W4X4_9EURY|nr:DNA-binding protein [Methanocella sp. CWC-04]MCD1293712.1 DNA-binding protein [Methanocella sp. CWC-04]